MTMLDECSFSRCKACSSVKWRGFASKLWRIVSHSSALDPSEPMHTCTRWGAAERRVLSSSALGRAQTFSKHRLEEDTRKRVRDRLELLAKVVKVRMVVVLLVLLAGALVLLLLALLLSVRAARTTAAASRRGSGHDWSDAGLRGLLLSEVRRTIVRLLLTNARLSVRRSGAGRERRRCRAGGSSEAWLLSGLRVGRRDVGGAKDGRW